MGILEMLQTCAEHVRFCALGEEDDPQLAEGRRLVKAYLRDAGTQRQWWNIKPQDLPTGKLILAADPAVQVSVVLCLLSAKYADEPRFRWLLQPLTALLSRRHLPYTEQDLLHLTRAGSSQLDTTNLQAIVRILEGYMAKKGLSGKRLSTNRLSEDLVSERLLPAPLQVAVTQLRASIAPNDSDCLKICVRLDALLGVEHETVIKPGEPWGTAALASLTTLTPQELTLWSRLLLHALSANGLRPSQKWLSTAEPLVEAIGKAAFQDRILDWFSLFEKSTPAQTGQGQTMEQYEEGRKVAAVAEHNYAVLKGLVWCCRSLDEATIAPALGDLAHASLKKIPGIGSRSAKVGNACIAALGEMTGMAPVAQLSRLKMRVKYQAALALIESALTAAAVRANLPPEDLEELSVPSFGLDAGGYLQEEFGGYSASLTITGAGHEELVWAGPNGKLIKTVPAEVRRDHSEALKALRRTVEEINKTLPAQRERMERQMLSGRSWSFSDWRERYLDHPLMGSLARRLIWHFETDGKTGLGLWKDGRLVSETGAELECLSQGSETTQVRLWHPLGFDPEVVLLWRRYLEENGIRQPFKQAHREVYLLTDAELNTRTYSNRFAAHVIRQHQFSALCRARGWKYQLQGGFDGHNNPTLIMPQWNLMAEFWVEPVAEDALNESGMYLYVSTDQVRFYSMNRMALPLTEVPALAFSEIMRDVDLFVGVCSVGNDPQWKDGGERGQHAQYWHDFAFGNLNASAKTREDVLSRLLPRLKIGPQCRLDGKFLRVEGKRRVYKIHLGSGNILMEPNDQYLCIVPDRQKSAMKAKQDVFLPFEGDQMLSVIISKAFLLADDLSIKDPTILSQIRR